MDLQGPLSPSAQDHSKTAINGKGTRHTNGRHQDQALRHAEQDMNDEIARGPLSPDPRKDVYHIDEEYVFSDQDESADHLNGLRNDPLGGYGSHMEEDVGEEDIDELDDDMLDKISSSPSIDDGGCISLGPFQRPPSTVAIFYGPQSQTLDAVGAGFRLDVFLFSA